ncbi:MAG: hypothetical protein ACKORF_07105, partial [Micrococcales bacterium]
MALERKTRVALANTAIVLTSLSGGVLVTNHLTESSGGLVGALGLNATPDSTATPAKTVTTKPDQTVTGDAINYQYGTIQLEVVRTGGKISAVNLVQAGANNGREAAFPYLQKYAVTAQGSNFSNLSGATFTTDAFKQALDS